MQAAETSGLRRQKQTQPVMMNASLRSVDRRPRQLLVTGVLAADTDTLVQHFKVVSQS